MAKKSREKTNRWFSLKTIFAVTMVSSVPKEDSVPITKFSASASESLMKKSGVAGMSELINRTLPHIHRSSFGPANQNRMTSEPQPITASHNLISFSSPASPNPHAHTLTPPLSSPYFGRRVRFWLGGFAGNAGNKITSPVQSHSGFVVEKNEKRLSTQTDGALHIKWEKVNLV